MDDGNVEVGVHIADVSYFVKAATALDETARSRATSVYLTQKVIIIMPPVYHHIMWSIICFPGSGDPHVTKATVWTIV